MYISETLEWQSWAVFFVSGIDTGVGKTIVTGLLAHWLQRQGRRVITVKMVQTGNDGFSEDLESHRAMMGGVSFPEDKADITVGTLSKALGGEGGFVCGRRLLCDYLRNRARGFIFTTAMSPVSAAVAREALRILQSSPELPVHLAENVRAFVAALCEHGVETQTQSAIVPIPIGDERRAVQVAAALHERGIFLSAIRYPTVARGQARLRAAVMATHAPDDLRAAAQTIATLL